MCRAAYRRNQAALGEGKPCPTRQPNEFESMSLALFADTT